MTDPTVVVVAPTPEPDVVPIPVPVPVQVEPEPEPPAPIVIAPEANEVEIRIRELEGRVNLHESTLAELRQTVETRAEVGHEHPVPPGLQALSDHLESMETEDVAPARKESFWKKKLWGN